MLSRLQGAVVLSLDAALIEIEVEHKNGFPGFEIVGLPDTAIKESRERISQAIRHSGFDFSFRKILCNLAPADIKKSGTYLDLPLAMGVLTSSGILAEDALTPFLFFGELGFNGAVRPVPGALSIALMARKKGIKKLVLPRGNLPEVQILKEIEYYPVESLLEALSVAKGNETPAPPLPFTREEELFPLDLLEVKGQEQAKRALEIAAAGFHNLLFCGSPGTGKTMLAKRLPTLLSPLSEKEAIAVTRIHSIAPHKGEFAGKLMTRRPFRSPHHTASDVSITGGGSVPKPGEISLAHHGVLFLDELPEFKKSVLEVLREPLESRKITVTRSERAQVFPAHFLLVGAMNPCPCGYLLHPIKGCSCNPEQVRRYYRKISGPILDRIDLQLVVPEVKYTELEKKPEDSATVKERVQKAVEIQHRRFGKIRFNSQMEPGELEKFCVLREGGRKILKQAVEMLGFSMRGYAKLLKIARTIADLAGEEEIAEEHLMEALQYRSLEKHMSSRGLMV